MSTKEKFYTAVEELQKKIRDTDNDKIEKAAQLMADSIEHDGTIHLFDTGHIIDMEIINRAGGLELMRPFKYNLNVISNDRKREERTKKEKSTSIEGLAALALNQGDVLPGDVMVIGSVSGKTINVIDLALACKKMGVKVIALTSVEYSSKVDAPHSSCKHLYEVADIVLDNCAPYADAMLEIEGLDSKFIPASGLAAAYIMWALNADLVDKLLEKGIQPGVLRSVNYEPNRQYNIDLNKRYKEKGY